MSAIFLGHFLWAQLAIQTMISLFMVSYILWFRPLESSFATKMEVMNEKTILLQMYMLMCFTDFVPEPETRNEIGIAYMGISVGNILIHLFFLVVSGGTKIKIVCRRKCCKPKLNRKAQKGLILFDPLTV
jgi:hypothetical protein